MEETLREYQKIGAQWLASKHCALLGDVPRLGKTAQAITACDMIGARKVLVLCPAIARFQWESEFKKFSTLGRTWDVVLSSKKPTGTADGVICSYDLAIRSAVATSLLSRRWDCIITDEGHYLNNRGSQRTKLVYGKLARKTARLWSLTGSPMRQSAADLWPFFRAAGLYTGDYWDFLNEYILTEQTPFGMNIIGHNPERLPDLKAMIDRAMLRRTLEDVLTELPVFNVTTHVVEASIVNARRWYPDVLLRRQTEESLLREVATELQHLESFVELAGEGSDMAADGLKGLQGHNTEKSRKYVGLQKAPSVAKIVSEELQAGEYQKIVLFAWHRDVVECLRLELKDWHPETLYGGMRVFARENAISKFRKDPRCKVIICNLTAAGVAIDLSVANHVGFVEASYVPEDNTQACMRVYKYGQTKPVFVRFFSLQHSVDEKIARILRRKTKALVEAFGTPATPDHEVYDPFAE